MIPIRMFTPAVLVVAAAVVCSAAIVRGGETERQGYRLAPKAFRAAVDKVRRSLVTIETYGGVVPSGGRGGRPVPGINRPGDGPTTGLVISDDGYIVTSTFNFIKKPPVITVILPDGTRKVATLLGRDTTRQICVLKIDGARGLAVPSLARREDLRVGQWAITVGVGYGDAEPAISAGIVSATSRISGRAVQTDANISPANYGGPLIDIDGRVIGVCVPLAPQSPDPAGGVEWYDSGIGFAVPLSGIEPIMAKLKAGKTVEPGRLGVQIKPAEGDGRGVVVEKVFDNSPAAKAGVKVGDRILGVAGEEVLDATQLTSLVGRYVAGDTVQLEVKRGDDQLKLSVTLENFVPPPDAGGGPPSRPPTDPRPPEPPGEG